MLYDYITAQERLKRLQPVQHCGWRCLFFRFKRNKKKKMAQKLKKIKRIINDYQLEPSCNNRKEIRTSVLQCDACQSFWINDDIQIVVLGFFKGVTHIGIEAPPETRIVKAEDQHKEQFHKDD